MNIKECIDIVDNIKPNQYTIKDKVMWLSFIEQIIINDVLKTHEGYDGRYDDFSGYTEDKISVTLIAPSPYDRLYIEYLKMMIDKENGEVARYNNSAASYNTHMMEYKKHYNKTHMPLSDTERKQMPLPNMSSGLSDAEYENLKKDMTYVLTEYFNDRLSPDKISDVVNSFVQNNIEMLKGKDGYTPKKGVDYFTEKDIADIKAYMDKLHKGTLDEVKEIVEKMPIYPIIDTGVTLDDTGNLDRNIKLFKKDGTEATDARDVYSGFLKFKSRNDVVPFTHDVMILQNIMEEGYIEYKEVHQIVFRGSRIYKRTVHVDCGDFDANGERAYPITQENYDDGNYNTGFYTVLWSDDLLDGGRLSEAIDKAIEESRTQPDYNQNNPKRADYIKNRPFYEGETVVLVDVVEEDGTTGVDELHYYSVDKTVIMPGTIVQFELYDGDDTYGATKVIEENDPFLQGDWLIDEQVHAFSVKLTETEIVLCTPIMEYFTFKLTVQTPDKPLDEKFIPDSVKNVQVDYNQNDPTQPNYIKNRPFYEEDALILSADVGLHESAGMLFAQMEFPKGEYKIGETITVEMTDNSTSEKFSREIIVNALHENGNPVFYEIIGDVHFDMQNSEDGTIITFIDPTVIRTDCSIKIFHKAPVLMDEKFLPKSVITEKNVGNYVSNTVPYIYSSEDEPVRVEALPSGVYILHGTFLTSLGVTIYDFWNEPNFCIVKNTGAIQLTWFNTAIGESGPTAFARFMFIQEGEILFDNTAPLC